METRRRSWRANAVRAVLGLALGLAGTEILFRLRDHGAFPHLNVYAPDAALGVRLRAGRTERIQFGAKANPVTSVRINRDGYRGEDWPAPAAGEVLVVGDSQVFGLGVEEGETFSAELARQTGAPVRNLGVPTYGPAEYNAVLAEQLERRRGQTVIWVANLANDLFEATRPNVKRHVVQDGWAVRAESASRTTPFPGRSFLFGRSHAVVALRRRLLAPAPAEGFASEGTWLDIGAAANDAEHAHAAADVAAKRLAEEHVRVVERARREATEENARVERMVEQELTLEERARLGFVKVEVLREREPFAEESRSVRVTARHIRVGAEMRRRMEAIVRERAAETHETRILDGFAKRDALNAAAGDLAAAAPGKPVIPSPLAAAIREAKATCDRFGARLLVVALPLDVQVSPEEWKKYGAPPVDMSATRLLGADVVTAAASVGAEGLDALDALAAAEPGAFLDGDIHLTPKGHRALASALTRVLAPR